MSNAGNLPSHIFDTEAYLQIAERSKKLLNAQTDFLSPSTVRSTRAVGDAVEAILVNNLQDILGPYCAQYSSTFARRAMADLAFTGSDGLYYVVDVKTHRIDTQFNMPNLTSVERLARFYEDNINYFTILLVKYRITGFQVVVSEVYFLPIEFLAWECLTIGALGWGQIQLANASRVVVRPHYPRKSWMLELCDMLAEFYPREIAKIGRRMEYFDRIRQSWEARP
jgi:hypothetical protein